MLLGNYKDLFLPHFPFSTFLFGHTVPAVLAGLQSHAIVLVA